MIHSDSPATIWAASFLIESYRQGVRDVVISPGSRSQALALAAYELSTLQGSELDVHVAVDERTGGFLALGIATHSTRPAILVSTSGSAPGHYLPALLEAKHSGIPLIVLSADRPSELRGVGANQTTRQPGMFGHAVSWSTDVDAPHVGADNAGDAVAIATQALDKARRGAAGHRPGPVHVNVSFREPLSAPLDFEEGFLLPSSAEAIAPAHNRTGRTVTLRPEVGTLVVAGHLAGSQAEQLARDLGAPLIAEVHSGAHFGPHLVVAYRELLSQAELSDRVVRVVTVGRPTLSREVQQLLQRVDIDHIVWQQNEAEPAHPSGKALVVDHIEVEHHDHDPHLREWVGTWVGASRDLLQQQAEAEDPPAPDVALAASDSMAERSRFARQEMDVYRTPLSRRAIAKAVWESTWPHDHLVLASSRMIRELDKVAAGKNIPVWSNRGLSGIDGTIATARGVALSRARQASTGVTRVLLGDLAFAHDAGSLLLDQGEAEHTSMQLVVVRDGGGSLFDLLEVARSAEASAYERVVFSPVTLDLESLAKAYSWEYRKVSRWGELSEALAWNPGHSIVDCVIDR